MEFSPGLFMREDRERWLERMLAGLQAFESVLGVTLTLANGGTKFHATIKPVPDRRKFLLQRLKTKNRWFSLTNREGGFRRTPNSLENVDRYGVGGDMYFGGELYGLHIQTPPLPTETAEKLLVAVGDAFEIDSAQWTPERASRRLRLAHWCIRFDDREHPHPLEDRTQAEANLPRIYESTYAGLSSGQPHHFGWLNYWSENVCRVQDLAGRADKARFHQSYRTPRGAQLIKLRDRPPAEIDDDFVERLRVAYAAFPGVGVR